MVGVMPRQRQKSVQSLDTNVPPEMADGPRSVPPMPGANPTPSPLTAGHMTPNPPPPSTDLGELIAPEVSGPTNVGPGHPMFDNGPHNSMMNFNRPPMGAGGPMGPNNMGPGFNNMGPGFNNMGPGPPPPNTIGPNQMGPGPPNSIAMNSMGPMPPNSMGQGPNNMGPMMSMGGFGPGHPGPGKVYPPNQPMVFNPSNPNAPPIYPCGYCHKEVHDNDQAILCESGCNFWFHRPCTGLTEPAYLMLTKEVYAEWSCDKCIQSKNIPLVKLKP